MWYVFTYFVPASIISITVFVQLWRNDKDQANYEAAHGPAKVFRTDKKEAIVATCPCVYSDAPCMWDNK